MPPKSYDVFISHNSDDKPWVRVLAENLRRAGVSYFLDEEVFYPGMNLVQSLYTNLQNSHAGILVVTPEAFHSSWVNTEYNQMMIRKQRDPHFQIIPCVLGDVPENFSFLDNLLQVDFRDPSRENYQRGLYQVLCGIRQQPPGPETRLPFEPKYPPISDSQPVGIEEESLLADIEVRLQHSQILLLLYQADRNPSSVIQTLKERMWSRFPVGNTWQIVPPVGRDEDVDPFYHDLAQQLPSAQEVHSHIAFDGAFRNLLRQKQGPVFLLITGFENAAPARRHELATLLRATSGMYTELRVVLCGGKRLYHLSRADGVDSLLGAADICEFPGLADSELRALANQGSRELPPAESRAILEATGGDCRLSHHCLRTWTKNSTTPYRELLLNDRHLMPGLWRPLLNNPDYHQQLRDLLKKDDLGGVVAFANNHLIQDLYWQGLLKWENHHLRWRCEAIREAGENLLTAIPQ
ncbi:MAG: toll/interleukin-1 receptor domain-containing protein [Magnetococcus sp. THC-1_WYH]